MNSINLACLEFYFQYYHSVASAISMQYVLKLAIFPILFDMKEGLKIL